MTGWICGIYLFAQRSTGADPGYFRKASAKKESKFIDDRLHLVEVHDGETFSIIDHDITFFDINSTKAKQFGFMIDIGNGKRLYQEEGSKYYHGNLIVPDDFETIEL